MVQTFSTFKQSMRTVCQSPFTLLLILVSICTFSCSVKTGKNDLEKNYYSGNNFNRLAAEWEPALGTMIVWPLCVPHKLVVELAKDNHLYTLVENESNKQEALKWYTQWGIDPARNTFIYAPQGIDYWWVRDWGPGAVFTLDGKMKLADGKYIYSTPITGINCNDSLRFLYMTKDNEIIKTETDDTATQYVGRGLNMELLDLPYINTGGNVLTDGLGTAFSTCALLKENAFFNVTRESFLDLNRTLLGINRYNVISNFEKGGIQHIDCYMKLLDEERILVAEPPKDHELYPVYENIIENELKKLITPYGRPYEILRLKTDRYNKEQLAAYTNSIIINKTIYVPLFRIKEDSSALLRWQDVMPGYTVKGFTFALADEPVMSQKMKDNYKNYGWNSGDALHCRTRAVWDTQMLFISIKRIDAKVDTKQDKTIYATIIDYSKKGLEPEKTVVNWRVKGETVWKSLVMKQVKKTDHYFAEIPYAEPGKSVEYYLSACSKSGRKETKPATAPEGVYHFNMD